MTVLDDREKRYEGGYGHSEEVEFKIIAKRDKLTGLWAAKQFGLKGEEAEIYARKVVEADLEEPGDKDVIRKLIADFNQYNVEMSDHRLEKKLQENYDIARDEIMGGKD